MELRVYLDILLKKWWLVIPTFLVTLTAGILLTYSNTPRYRATSTYIVAPGAALSGDAQVFRSSLDVLSRRDEIASTFTQIASSQTIKRQTLDSLDIESGAGYSINSNLRAGTNIIEFTAQGPDPVIVRDLANQAGGETDQYIQGLYEVFVILPLDQATLPRSPYSPNYSLNIILASILGLVLGAGVAFLSEYLETPVDWIDNINIIDSQTGVYNKEYFLRRLRTEMVRAKRNHYPLSVALMRVDNLGLLKGHNADKIRIDFLHQVALLINQHLKEEDILAYLKDDTFAFILPDITGENAEAMMEYLQARVSWIRFQATNTDIQLNLKGIFGVTTYNYNGTSYNELIEQASQALQIAKASKNGKVYLFNSPTSIDEN